MSRSEFVQFIGPNAWPDVGLVCEKDFWLRGFHTIRSTLTPQVDIDACLALLLQTGVAKKPALYHAHTRQKMTEFLFMQHPSYADAEIHAERMDLILLPGDSLPDHWLRFSEEPHSGRPLISLEHIDDHSPPLVLSWEELQFFMKPHTADSNAIWEGLIAPSWDALKTQLANVRMSLLPADAGAW